LIVSDPETGTVRLTATGNIVNSTAIAVTVH
jgi:hypothetical protein